MPLDRFFDKDIIDNEAFSGYNKDTHYWAAIASMQLSRDIKQLILAIRSLKAELDGDIQ